MRQTTLTTVVCLLLSIPAHATVLTFDIAGATNPSTMPQSYGDAVTATNMGSFSYGALGGFTPNVSVSYESATGGELNFWSTGYNDLVNVLENEADGEIGYSITFTADPGFRVVLESLDMGNWGAAITVPGMEIKNGSGSTLANYPSILLADSATQSHASFTPSVQGQTLVLHVDTTGLSTNSDNVGLDNIQFSQVVVPEPAAACLVATALLGLLPLRSRRSSH